MNSFGRLFKIEVFGESHGSGVGVIIDGCPAGLKVPVADFMPDMLRRQGGNQKGATPRKEDDIPDFKSGVFNETTTGTPLLIFIENKNTRSGDYEKQRSIPRPGHADFVAHKKFGGFEDFRGGGHFSARVTTGIVAAGVIAKKLLSGVTIEARIVEVAGEPNIDAGLQKAIDAKDSVGGIIECRVSGLSTGLGEPFFDSVESVIAHMMFTIPAVKGVEFGAGFEAAKMFGSQHNDAILNSDGLTKTNYAGGIVGGITNGNDIIFRIAIKPTASTPKMQESFNWDMQEIETFSIKGRHDLCVALRAPVIVEAFTAIALVDFMMLEDKIKRVVS